MFENNPNFSCFSPAFGIGICEDRQDPLKLGRIRVRIIGFHTDDKTLIPTEDLQWQKVMMPVTAGQITGIGETPLGPLPGTWVVLMCMDSNALQEWLVIGTLTGIPEEATQKPRGFFDPRNDPKLVETLETAPRKIESRSYKYDGSGISLTPEKKARNYPREINPLDNVLNEPDINRLARNEKINDTIIQLKHDTRDTQIPISFGGSWDELDTPYNANYPYNHVIESESGHIEEVDDTPNAERTHRWNRTGSFEEIGPDGSKVIKVVMDSYEVVMRNEFIHICGTKDETVHKDYNLYVQGDWNIQVDGNVNMLVKGTVYEHVLGDVHSSVDGSIHIESNGDETHIADNNTTFNTGGKFSVIAAEVDIKTSGDINLDGANVWINSGKANPNIAPEPIEPKVASWLSGLGTSLGSLNPSQLGSLTPDILSGLSLSQLATLTPSQIASFSPSQLASFSPSQLASFSPSQLSSLLPAQLTSFSPSQLTSFSPSQLAGFSPSQLASLLPSQLTSFSPSQLASFSPSQLSGLLPSQLASFSPSQLASFSPSQIAGFSPTQLSGLSASQLVSLHIP